MLTRHRLYGAAAALAAVAALFLAACQMTGGGNEAQRADNGSQTGNNPH